MYTLSDSHSVYTTFALLSLSPSPASPSSLPPFTLLPALSFSLFIPSLPPSLLFFLSSFSFPLSPSFFLVSLTQFSRNSMTILINSCVLMSTMMEEGAAGLDQFLSFTTLTTRSNTSSLDSSPIVLSPLFLHHRLMPL